MRLNSLNPSDDYLRLILEIPEFMASMVARGECEPDELRTPAPAEGQGDFLPHVKPSRITVTGLAAESKQEVSYCIRSPVYLLGYSGRRTNRSGPSPLRSDSIWTGRGEISGGHWMAGVGGSRAQ